MDTVNRQDFDDYNAFIDRLGHHNHQNAPREFRPIGGGGGNDNPPTPGSSELSIAGTPGVMQGGPNARTLSNILSTQPDGVVVEDETGASAYTYVFGQFVDHDLGLKLGGGDDISIPVPAGDPDLPDGTVIPLSRAMQSADGTEINTVAGYLDLSQVYGSTQVIADSLRNDDGTMKTSAGNALPLVDGHFVAGDVRVEENPELVTITTLFVRNHNSIVAQLKADHPKWTGDRLYNEARTLNIAQYQNIVYKEFLPTLINPDSLGKYKGFDPTVNPQETQEFSVAAFRVGHTQVSNEQIGGDNQGNITFEQPLAEAFLNTPQQTLDNGLDNLLRHLAGDDSQAVDLLAVNGLRNLLVAPPNAIDLIATDIQRERDAGLGTLNETRAALGLTPYTSFDQISSDPEVVVKLEEAFGTVDQVDLFMGGLAEDHAPGANVGETFQAIIADQFTRVRDGDPYYWERTLKGSDKQDVGNTTLSDILSRNTDTPILQKNSFISTERHLSSVAPENPDAPQLVIGVNDRGAIISGGGADDTIAAGDANKQTLTGGDGADDFVFSYGSHSYSISDFLPGTDTMRFLLNGKSYVTSDHGDVVVHHGTDTVTLTGVTMKELRQGGGLGEDTPISGHFGGVGH